MDPTRLFLQRDRLPWIWFGLAVTVAVLAASERFHLVSEIKRPQSVVIIDPSRTYYVSPTLAFQDAKELHAEQATLATLSLLTRNPKDFDHPEPAKDLERYFQSAGMGARERVALMRLAWDFLGTEFGSRHQQYEKFYGGASFIVKMNAYRHYDFKRALALVDEALKLKDD